MAEQDIEVLGPEDQPPMGHTVTDLMVDIETTGLRPDRNAVLQIAIVPFNLHARTVFEGDYVFNICLGIPPQRAWDESTRSWWFSKNPEVYTSICARAIPPDTAINHLYNYLHHFKDATRFWGLRAFDWPFIESYLHDYGYKNPIKYTKFREIETALDAMNLLRGGYQQHRVKPKEGAHDAYVDCLFQIQSLFNGMEANGYNLPQQTTVIS